MAQLTHNRPSETYIGNVSFYRCDQCTIANYTCDRILPKCDRCANRNFACSLNRKILRKRSTVKNKKAQSMRTDNFVVELKETFLYKKKAVKSRKFNKVSIKNYTCTVSSLLEGSATIVRAFFNGFALKSAAYNLYVLTSYPQSICDNSSLATFILATKKFDLILIKSNRYPKLIPKIDIVVNQLVNSFQQSFQIYFKLCTSYEPLFISSNFNCKPRSPLLLLSIWLRGYYMFTERNNNSFILSYAAYKLYHELSKSLQNPSLDLIQALIILQSGVKLDWIVNNRNIHLAIALRTANAIGLTQATVPPKRKFSLDGCERWLALSALHKHLFFNGWISQSLPVSLGDFTSYDNDALLNRNLLSKMYNVLPPSQFFLAMYFNSTVHIIQNMHKCQHLAFCELIAEPDLHIQIQLINLNIKDRTLAVLTQLHLVKQHNTHNPKITKDIDKTINLINFIYHFTLFRIYSLPIALKRYNLANQFISSPNGKLIVTCLETAGQVINFATHIDPSLPADMFFPIVTQCFVFLLRHKNYHMNPATLKSVIAKAYTDYEKIMNNYDSQLVKLNLAVINSINELTNGNQSLCL